MNEQLQVALAEIINTTIQAKDFVLEQAPDVIHQLLAWKFITSLLGFWIGILCIVAFAVMVKKTVDWFRKYNAEPNAHTISGIFAITLLPFVAALFLSFSGLAWLQIWIAPKVYLLEYAAKLAGQT